MPAREDQVAAAVQFLKNPGVQNRSAQEKQDFLLGKGLTQEEIDEAVRRNNGASSASPSGASPTATSAQAAPARPSVAPGAALPTQAPGTLPGGYPAPVAGTMPGGYPAPVAGTMPGGYPPPLPPATPWPQPVFPAMQMQAPSTPWWTWLLGGLSVGSMLALIANMLWPRRPLQPPLALHGAMPGMLQGQSSWAPQQLPQASAWPSAGVSSATQWAPPGANSAMVLPALPAPVGSSPLVVDTASSHAIDGAASAESSAHATPSVARLDELAGHVRRHVEETREATSSLRRTLEQQQRQYQAAFSDFQRKVDEAAKRKPSAPLPRIEIAPESLKTLKSLIHASSISNGSAESLASPEDIERQWFSQVDQAILRYLRSVPSKVEAKKGVQTLCLIVNNLVTSGGQEKKFTEVNTSSTKFRENFQGPDGGAGGELLQLAGFERRESGFVFPSEGRSLDKAERVRDILQACIRDAEERWEQSQAEAGAVAVASSPTASEASSPKRPPWASAAASVNGAASSTAPGGVAAPVAPEAAAARPPAAAPWQSSAMQRVLSRTGASSASASASAEPASEGPLATNAPAAVHPAESAAMEETQRAPG